MTDQHIPNLGLIAIAVSKSKHGMPVTARQLRIHNVETGEDIGMDTNKLVLVIDCNIRYPYLTADLTRLTDGDGNPLGASGKLVVDENGEPRTGVFRYGVASIELREEE